MINTIKNIHKYISIVPFVWFVIFIMFVIVGTIVIGHLPVFAKEIIEPDNLPILGHFTTIEAILSYISFIIAMIWPILTLIFWSICLYKKKYNFNIIPTILFIIALIGYLIFYKFYPEVLNWVAD